MTNEQPTALEQSQPTPFSPEHLAAVLEGYRSSNVADDDILPVAQNDLGDLADVLLKQYAVGDDSTKKLAGFMIEKVTKVYLAIQYARERIDELSMPPVN